MSSPSWSRFSPRISRPLITNGYDTQPEDKGNAKKGGLHPGLVWDEEMIEYRKQSRGLEVPNLGL